MATLMAILQITSFHWRFDLHLIDMFIGVWITWLYDVLITRSSRSLFSGVFLTASKPICNIEILIEVSTFPNQADLFIVDHCWYNLSSWSAHRANVDPDIRSPRSLTCGLPNARLHICSSPLDPFDSGRLRFAPLSAPLLRLALVNERYFDGLMRQLEATTCLVRSYVVNRFSLCSSDRFEAGILQLEPSYGVLVPFKINPYGWY